MKGLRDVAIPYGLLLATLFAFVPWVAADTGKELYQARCAECHGKKGEGRSRMKAPGLMSAKVKRMSDNELREMISERANGEMEKKSSHTLLKKRMTAEQVGEVIAYIRGLQSGK